MQCVTIKAAQLNCKYRAVAEPVSGRGSACLCSGPLPPPPGPIGGNFSGIEKQQPTTTRVRRQRRTPSASSFFFYRHTTAFGHNKGALCDLSGHPYLSLAHDGTRAQHDASRFSPKTRDPCKSKVCAFPSCREDGARFFVRFPFIARVLRCSV